MENQQHKLIVFQNKDIRRVWHKEEWFYSVVDIVEVLTDSPTPRQYWGKVKDLHWRKSSSQAKEVARLVSIKSR